MIEEKEYCKTITAERVKRVGGAFDFYELGATITNKDNTLNTAIPFEELAKFVWLKETGTPRREEMTPPLLGIHEGKAIYLLGDREILTRKTFAGLPQHDGEKIIYGAACRVDEEFLQEKKIIFRQMPEELG